MTFRRLVLEELGALLSVLSHPARLRLVEELRADERDVNTLSEAVGVAQTRISQHLSLLRSHRVVVERREGRHVFYRLARPELAEWLLDGFRFIEPVGAGELQSAVEFARGEWSAPRAGAAAPRASKVRSSRRGGP